MRLTPEERETIILYNEAGDTASVYTHDPRLMTKLRSLHERDPEKVYPEGPVNPDVATYTVPKRCVTVRPPYSDQRRRAQSENAKRQGLLPPSQEK